MAASTSRSLWGLSLLSCTAIPVFAWMTEPGKKFIFSQMNIPWNLILPPFTLLMACVVHYLLISFIELAFLANQNAKVQPSPSVWTKTIIEIVVGIWVMLNAIVLAPSLPLVYLLISYSTLVCFVFVADCQ